MTQYTNSLIILLSFAYMSYSSFDPLLLDEKALTNSSYIQTYLINQGFKKIFFTTPDNIKICALFLDKSKKNNIKGTIMYCAGFYPGTKEGMSSFYALIAQQPYNVLLFDARGHQESEGCLFSYTNLKQYGTYEYQDIIGALQFLETYNQENNINPKIVIHGICSGAFHAIKAQHTLKNNHTISGIIFDSGWLQVTDVAKPTICTEIHRRLKGTFFEWMAQPLCNVALFFYSWTLYPNLCKVTGIAESIKTITCPIFFIHCINDPYVPYDPIKKIIKEINCDNVWLIDHDSHVNFHTKEPKIYAEKIENFLNKVLQ